LKEEVEGKRRGWFGVGKKEKGRERKERKGQ
jgi:hypothetical protein